MEHSARWTMKRKRALVRFLIYLVGLVLIVFILYGCAGIGLMSGLNVGNISDTIILETPHNDILALGINVAYSMGFRVTSRDMAQNMVLLQYGDLGSFGNPLPWLIGKIDNSHITITVLNARSLSVQIRTAGTFGSGNYADAVSLLDEFKKRIYMRMQ